MRSSLALHYLEIKVSGLKLVPKNKPLLIAATHPNSFLDAIIIASVIDRPLHFLARSDVFRNSLANKILRSLNLIPIYRLQEGAENLSKNEATFSECHEILEQNGAILIFVEGISLTDMRIRPLKKGLARIAFSYMTKFNKTSCAVLPIALNYDRPTEFRSKINVAICDLINAGDFLADYKLNENKAYSLLNNSLFNTLKTHTVEVEDKDYMVYKAMAELDSCFEQNALSRKILIAEHVKSTAVNHPKQYSELKTIVENSHQLLKKYKLNFRKLKANHGISNLKIVQLIIGFPFFMGSLLINALPFLLATLVANKLVKLEEFYASVRLASGTLFWIIYSTALTILLLRINLIFIVTPLLQYMLLKYYSYYYEQLKYFRASNRLRRLNNNEQDVKELQQNIKAIYRLRKAIDLAPSA